MAAEPDERGLSGGAHVWAMLVGVNDERRAEFRGERRKGAASLRALLERAWIVAEEEVDLAAPGEALEGGPLERSSPMPAAAGVGDWRPAVGQTAQATETEPRSRRQMVQAEPEPHRAGHAGPGVGAGERLGVVVVSVHEQKLEPRSVEQGTGGTEKATTFRFAREVVQVAQGHERVAALVDGTLDQAAQMTSVAVQVAEHEQTTHLSRAYRAPSAKR